MKLFYRLTLLLIGLVTIYSCSEDDFDRTPILTLSEKSITFTREVNVESIDVTINDGDEFFHALDASGAGWISVEREAGRLKVSVTENTSSENRVGTIEVLLRKGGLKETITVTQSGDSGYITITDDTFVIQNIGGNITIYVESNAKWIATVEDGASWLTIVEQSKGKLIVSAPDNDDPVNGRTGLIKLSTPGVEGVMVNIIQKGPIHYDFPFLNIGYNYDGPESERGVKYHHSIGDANTFEQARGSTLIDHHRLGPTYQTRSTLFPTVGYGGYSELGIPFYPSVKLVSVSCSIKPFEVLEDPLFLEYMQEEGFEFAWRDDSAEVATYWSKEREIAIQFLNYDDAAGNRLTFSHARTKPDNPTFQTNVYPTFDYMPAIFTETGATLGDIMAWEGGKGSFFNAKDSTDEVLVFVPDLTKEPYAMERVYYMDTSTTPATFWKALILINHLDKAFYFSGDMSGDIGETYVLIGDFIQLMELDGYMLMQVTGKMAAFYGEVTGIMPAVYVGRYQAEGFLPRLVIEYYLPV